MYNLSCDYASKAAEKNTEILKEANIEENCEPVVVAHQRKVGSGKNLYMKTFPKIFSLIKIF